MDLNNELAVYTSTLSASLLQNIIIKYNPDARVNTLQGIARLDSILRPSVVPTNIPEELVELPLQNVYSIPEDLDASDIITEQDEEIEDLDEGQRSRTTDREVFSRIFENLPDLSRNNNVPVDEGVASIFESHKMGIPVMNTASSMSVVQEDLIKEDDVEESMENSANSTNTLTLRMQNSQEESLSACDLAVYSAINKDGYLTKKCSNILLGWQKRYVVIHNTKFLYAKTQKDFIKKKKIRCINFLTQKCQIIDVNGEYFCLAVLGTKTKLKLRADDKAVAIDWIDRLNKLLHYIAVREMDKSIYPLMSEKKPWKMDQLTEDEFMKTAKTGDILLFQTKNFYSKVQRTFTMSSYDHVAVMIRFKEELFYFDATGSNGASMTCWNDFHRYNWKKYYSRIVLRHLELEAPIRELDDILYEFIIDTSGAEYRLNMLKIMKRISTTHEVGQQYTEARKNEGYFCSELIAAAYKKLGLLDNRTASAQYWPVSFSSKKNIKLLKGAKLSNEMTILFNE